MRRPPAADAPRRSVSMDPCVPCARRGLRGTLPVPLAALAVPDQATVCMLYQWLATLRTRLVGVQYDPPALHRCVRAAVADGHWPALFHAVQQLGTTHPLGTPPVVDAVLHDIRGSFTTLAGTMELLVAGDPSAGCGLVTLVQEQLHTLGHLIPDLAARHPGDGHRR